MKLRKVLRKVPLFNDFTKEDIDKIIPLLEEEVLPAESFIINEGSVGNSMHIISKGSVRVLKKVHDNEEIVINHMYQDTYFGELALIDNLPRSASVITNEKTTILLLRKTALDKLLEDNPNLARVFYKNCLKDTFSRYREITSEFSNSKHDLEEKSNTLKEISRDLSSAKKLQDFFINTRTLNHKAYRIKGLKQSFVYNPCQEIGGDFLNLIEIGHQKYGIVIADVMGHGITAALATGAFKSAFSLMVKDLAENPSLLLASMNNHFFKDISTLFASCLFGFIDLSKREFTLARAGHYYPVFYRSSEKNIQKLELKGPALGLKKHATYDQEIYKIDPGDKLLFFTDGIIEQRNLENEMYTEKHLISTFLDLSINKANSILSKIEKDLDDFVSGVKKDDDITMLLLEFK